MLRATAQQFDFTSTLGLISDRRWMNQHESMTNSIRSATAPPPDATRTNRDLPWLGHAATAS